MTPISQLDWPRILYRRKTAIFLGIAAVFAVEAMLLSYCDFDVDKLSPLKNGLLGIAGVAGILGFLSLLVCMGFFWLRCDDSSKTNRAVWFFLLLLGCVFGTQILYYAIVYVPAVVRKLRSPLEETLEDEPVPEDSGRRRIGPFSGSLFVVWGITVLPAIAICVVPRSAPVFTGIVAVVFFLCSAVVVFESIFHFVVSIFRAGMRRPTHSDKANPSVPFRRD